VKIVSWFMDARVLKRFHGAMTVIWGILIPVSVATGLKESLVWVVLMSVWANFVGHFSSWQATRIEVKHDESS
jgi:hypothetical protein